MVSKGQRAEGRELANSKAREWVRSEGQPPADRQSLSDREGEESGPGWWATGAQTNCTVRESVLVLYFPSGDANGYPENQMGSL